MKWYPHCNLAASPYFVTKRKKENKNVNSNIQILLSNDFISLSCKTCSELCSLSSRLNLNLQADKVSPTKHCEVDEIYSFNNF